MTADPVDVVADVLSEWVPSRLRREAIVDAVVGALLAAGLLPQGPSPTAAAEFVPVICPDHPEARLRAVNHDEETEHGGGIEAVYCPECGHALVNKGQRFAQHLEAHRVTREGQRSPHDHGFYKQIGTARCGLCGYPRWEHRRWLWRIVNTLRKQGTW